MTYLRIASGKAVVDAEYAKSNQRKMTFINQLQFSSHTVWVFVPALFLKQSTVLLNGYSTFVFPDLNRVRC